MFFQFGFELVDGLSMADVRWQVVPERGGSIEKARLPYVDVLTDLTEGVTRRSSEEERSWRLGL